MRNPLLNILASARSLHAGIMRQAIQQDDYVRGRPRRRHETPGAHGNVTRAERIFRKTGDRTDHLQFSWQRDGYQSQVHEMADRNPVGLTLALNDQFHPLHELALEAKRLKLIPETSILF